MSHPVIINSKVIGQFAGQDMKSWSEVFHDGTVRHFEEYVTTCWLPSLGRYMGLTMVREVTEA